MCTPMLFGGLEDGGAQRTGSPCRRVTAIWRRGTRPNGSLGRSGWKSWLSALAGAAAGVYRPWISSPKWSKDGQTTRPNSTGPGRTWRHLHVLASLSGAQVTRQYRSFFEHLNASSNLALPSRQGVHCPHDSSTKKSMICAPGRACRARAYHDDRAPVGILQSQLALEVLLRKRTGRRPADLYGLGVAAPTSLRS